MKNPWLLSLLVLLGSACNQQSAKNDTQTITDTTAAVVKRKDCKSLADAAKLGKADIYKESSKPLQFALTLDQDSTWVETPSGCIANNTITVLATKKSGQQAFKRTLTKEDLTYFLKNDEEIEASILQQVTYKPTFNSQKYIVLAMHLVDPKNDKTLDYAVYMNYFGEIVKVKL
ncbi:hypothetical protein [Arsenicibacter rosenii]|uniref:Beta-lactamase-inhibitor-like PepSY-like domain-containing protein n=1 Tax=Arsenicibacter rosenii TaxID=1750698 RepID=A0A1S2VA99_9BACT|nr:hypothetical protein [Arsenicibacter rosenii]OIN55664.1 hypothetical protein BLX24_28830 [Arsenicibacter rosenii]